MAAQDATVRLDKPARAQGAGAPSRLATALQLSGHYLLWNSTRDRLRCCACLSAVKAECLTS
eukprot:4621207-Lingulodinium_polyedra.AAC.1